MKKQILYNLYSFWDQTPLVVISPNHVLPAEVGDGPGDVAEEPDGDAGGVDEADERLDDAVVDHVVAQRGAVSRDVAQGPNRLKMVKRFN